MLAQPIQLIGIIFLGIGIGIEIVQRAELGYILITVGAAIFAVGTKIKHGGKKN